MWIMDGVLAGLIAGVIMGFVSQISYCFGILKSHLIIIDGRFALQKMNRNDTGLAVYLTGIVLHLITSMVFGIIYVLIARLFGFDVRNITIIIIYFFILWLAMLFFALPVAGQGSMGNKIHRFVWLEQLVLHIIFGLSFWGILQII